MHYAWTMAKPDVSNIRPQSQYIEIRAISLLFLYVMVGWFVVMGLTVFQTLFQSLSDRLQEREGE